MVLKAFGQGKLILCGEHAVLRGAPALVLTLDRGVEIRYAGPEKGEWSFPGTRDEFLPALDALLNRAEEIYPALKPCRGPLFISSDLPAGRGFGSSAALWVAIARLIFLLLNLPGDKENLWRLAHHLEGVFHGAPSGIDTGSAIFGGVNLYTPCSGGDLPLRVGVEDKKIPLQWGSVPRRGGTKQIIGTLKSLSIYEGSMDRLSELNQRFIWEYRSQPLPDLRLLGRLMEQMQDEFRTLGLTTPEMDRRLEEARGEGALGGKLSGAGGGGAYCLVKGAYS